MIKTTAVEWLKVQIKEQQKSYIDLAKKDKSLKKGVDAILTATTLLLMKCNKAKEMEKQQIIEAVDYGKNHSYDYSEDNEVDYYSAEDYYNETFKK